MSPWVIDIQRDGQRHPELQAHESRDVVAIGLWETDHLRYETMALWDNELEGQRMQEAINISGMCVEFPQQIHKSKANCNVFTQTSTHYNKTLLKKNRLARKILNLATVLLTQTFNLSSQLIVRKAHVKLGTGEHDAPKGFSITSSVWVPNRYMTAYKAMNTWNNTTFYKNSRNISF